MSLDWDYFIGIIIINNDQNSLVPWHFDNNLGLGQHTPPIYLINDIVVYAYYIFGRTMSSILLVVTQYQNEEIKMVYFHYLAGLKRPIDSSRRLLVSSIS